MTMPYEPLANSMNAGYTGAGRGTESPGLEAQSDRWNSLVQGQLGKPQSVLSQIGLSPLAQNASAPDMTDRYNSITGTVLPNLQTGASETSAQTALKLRFAGDQEA